MPLDPKNLEGHKPGDQKFLKIIDDYGWHVMSVAPLKNEEGDLWSYSTGLYYHYKHPEIVIFNEPTNLRQSMINAVGSRVKAGERFEPGHLYAGIIGNHYVQFRPMHPSHYWDWLNFACWFYDDDENSFPVLQCFYPDMEGRFPWEPGCAQWAIEQQPMHDKPKI